MRILNERFYGNEPLVRYHKQPIKMSHGGMPSRSFIMSGGLNIVPWNKTQFRYYYVYSETMFREYFQSFSEITIERIYNELGNWVLDRRALETGTLWVPVSNFLGLKTVRRISKPAQSAGFKCPRV